MSKILYNVALHLATSEEQFLRLPFALSFVAPRAGTPHLRLTVSDADNLVSNVPIAHWSQSDLALDSVSRVNDSSLLEHNTSENRPASQGRVEAVERQRRDEQNPGQTDARIPR